MIGKKAMVLGFLIFFLLECAIIGVSLFIATLCGAIGFYFWSIVVLLFFVLNKILHYVWRWE